MARSCLAIFLLLCLLSSLFLFSCSGQVPENSPTPEQNGTLEPEPDAADVPEEETPESDFECIEENGSWVIKKYNGTGSVVNVPPIINGKEVNGISALAFSQKECVTVYLPEGIETIGNSAFEGCKKLEKIQLPKTLKEFGYRSFGECSSLKCIVIPEGIKSLNPALFEMCENLETVTLPSALTEIGNSAFKKCLALKEISFPSKLERIGLEAFSGCKSLKNLFVPKTIKEFSSAFTSAGIETLVLEEGLTNIGDYAFSGIEIKEVMIPSSVEKIGYGAFYGCEKLSKITLAEGIKYLDIRFIEKTAIKEIIIPSSVSETPLGVQKSSFMNAYELEKVYFDGVAPIDYTNEYEFYNPDIDLYLNYIVCYHEGAKGFTSPEWNGFKTEIW